MFLERFRASDVIAVLGGIKDVSDMLGVTPAAVSQWRVKGTFPASRALQLADHTGLTPEWFHNPWVGMDGVDVPYGTAEDLRRHLAAMEAVR